VEASKAITPHKSLFTIIEIILSLFWESFNMSGIER